MDPYDGYDLFDFNIPIGVYGDSYDRYIIRLEEMRQSLSIITQALKFLKYLEDIDLLDYNIQDHKVVPPTRGFMKFFMESLISHFKIYSEGVNVPREEVFSIVEAPKGEFGIYLVSNDTNIPNRCHIKAPGFLHLQGLIHIVKGVYLADLVTIIGTLDLVFGEIDR
jgi:NADH:ubiquinone oxidoreductase subunit D